MFIEGVCSFPTKDAWGTTLEEASEFIRIKNEQLGLKPKDVDQILTSGGHRV